MVRLEIIKRVALVEKGCLLCIQRRVPNDPVNAQSTLSLQSGRSISLLRFHLDTLILTG